MVTLKLRQLSIPPGQRLVIRDVSWQEFEEILEELGEHRGSRIAYDKGTLEIMAPLPEHEKSKEFVGDFVKILLEELEIDNECFGSTTFKRKDLGLGIEPDQCFCIQNHEAMRGMDRLDLTVDPPPDLAIEIDITSKTQLEIYAGLGVPELWIYGNGRLQIYLLQDGTYGASTNSPNFPNLLIAEAVPQFVQSSIAVGRNQTIKAFRAWVREQIATS